MYSEIDLRKIREIVLSEIFDVERIYIFGSYSRGVAKENSDIDIAIIVKSKLDWKERKTIMNNIYRKTAESEIIADFLLKDMNSYEREKKLPTISRIIEREGRYLWKRN